MDSVMEERKHSFLFQIISIIDPWKLLLGVIFYALGAAIASYLKEVISWDLYFSGQILIICLHISSMYMEEFFSRISNRRLILQEKRLQITKKRMPFSNYLLLISFSFLTITLVFCLLLINHNAIHLFSGCLLSVVFLLLLSLSVPPMMLRKRGAGEFFEGVMVANLIPAFSLSLQGGQPIRLLATLTLPLFFLVLSGFMAITLPAYGKRLEDSGYSMMERLGWRAGMLIHNILILCSYLVMLLAVLLGQSWRITWPGLLTVLIAIPQVMQIIAIGRGAKPRWGLVKLLAYSLPAITTYLFVFTLWIR
jgi:hypothetical protein